MGCDWIDQAQIGFVDEGGGLEGLAAVSTVQVGAGERVKLAADLRGKLVQSGGITAAPIDEQLGDAARAAHGGSKAIGKKYT